MKPSYIYLNFLYNKDKDLAISKIKESPLDIPLALQVLNTDFLKNLDLWTPDIKSQIIKYNTSSFYRIYRCEDVSYKLLDLLYTFSQTDQSYYNDKLDSNIILDFLMSMNINYYNINLSGFLNKFSTGRYLNKSSTGRYLDKSSTGRYITMDFMKLVKFHNKQLFYDLIKQNPDLLSFILANDKKLIDENILISLMGTKCTEIALLNLPYEKWGKYRHFMTDDFFKKYYKRFKLRDLFLLKDHTFIWSLIQNEPYNLRYKMYSEMPYNEKVISVVRQDLKNLVKSNYKILSGKYRSHVSDTLSIIKEIVDQIIIYPILVDLVYLVISDLEDMAKDMCMYYILKYITDKPEFINSDKLDKIINSGSFCKWYVNIVRLLKLIYKDTDKNPLQDLVNIYIRNKRYSAILLVEITGKCDTFNLEDVFLYEEYNIKLKEEVFERYQKFNILKKVKCDLKYMTTLEVNKLDIDIPKFEFSEEYLYIRNVARLVSNNMDRIKDFDNLKELFMKCCESQEEDIRLVGNSMMSKIEIYKRQ